MTTQLATRVMRARRTGGLCPECGRVLIQGQLIALAGRRWWHASCLVATAETERS